MKLELTKKNMNLLLILAAIVVTVGFGYFWIKPAIVSISDLKQECEELTIDLEEAERKQRECSVLERDAENARHELEKTADLFYSYEPSERVDQFMTGMFQEYGFKVKKLYIQMPESRAVATAYREESAVTDSEGEEENTVGVYKVLVEVSLVGSRDVMMQMMDEWSEESPKIKLEEVRWGEETQEGVQVDMTLGLYMYQEEKQ